jgi:energy-coupling factor transporter transmembrane protein EcfT
MLIPKGLNPYFRAIALIGFGLLIVDTSMSAAFGYTIGFIPMIGLALISLGSGLLLVCAEFFRRIGWRHIGSASIGVWALAFAFNCWSNLGVATSTRMGEVQQATVQKAVHTERQKSTEEAQKRLELFTGQLAELTTANSWAATVSADGLRSQVDALKVAEASEAKRGGCGPKCRAIQDKIVDTQGRIAVAEQRDDLTKRIDATKQVLANARTELAGTKAGISATANQSALYAKLISWDLGNDPDAVAVTIANESTGVAMAIVIAIASAFLTLIGALPHLIEADPSSAVAPKPLPRKSEPTPIEPVGNQVAALREQLQAQLRVIQVPLREKLIAA